MSKVRIRFAYRQGFRRLWIVASVIWLAIVTTVTVLDQKGLADVFLYGIAPIVVLYLFGAACAWIIEGFAKPE